jgi:hypothetical protein
MKRETDPTVTVNPSKPLRPKAHEYNKGIRLCNCSQKLDESVILTGNTLPRKSERNDEFEGVYLGMILVSRLSDSKVLKSIKLQEC